MAFLRKTGFGRIKDNVSEILDILESEQIGLLRGLVVLERDFSVNDVTH